MRRPGLFAVCLLAAALFGINRYCPELGEEMKLRLKTVTEGEMEYIEMIETLGRELSAGIFGDELQQVMGSEAQALNESMERAMQQWQEAMKPAQEQTEQTDSGQLPDMVSAFIAEQLSYNSQVIPTGVRLDMPQLPFEYGCPVEGSGSSGFGYREHPIENTLKFHYGTDFAARLGTEVRAFADGTVNAAGWDESYGNYVILGHEGEGETLYAHLQDISLCEGESVKLGELVGHVGATGLVTGPHLHFELKLCGKYINPEFYL